jgi:hypothetical protein
MQPQPATGVPGTTTSRRRPFGVIVVALLQLATVGVAILGFLSVTTIPWQGTFARALADHGMARGSIVTFGVLVVVAAVGMWRLRYWGWALMLALVGLALLLDLTTWWAIGGTERDLALYARMLLDVVCAFYLNSSAVQSAFRADPEPGTPAPIGTQTPARSAGSTQP